ncbi:Iron-sulfur assembly protein 1 [Trypanosoma equiperdum]|uniref:Iron-sulfur assembly protein 1 n=1 Tax=Trypanosoma equiperdum TaxID=5694 RepID=A0A1G4I5N7_TRYEQ|nr:Iron-sulfur assembly protein 1 [Trypanosoma equiperdum]
MMRFFVWIRCLGLPSRQSIYRSGCAHASTSAIAEMTANGVANSPVMPYKSTHKGKGVGDPNRKGSSVVGAPSGGTDQCQQNLAGSRSSCAEDGKAAPSRPLSPLQRRQLMMRHKAAFTLTPQAIRRVRYLLSQYQQNNKGEGPIPDGIRVSVRRRGCSGYSYTVNYNYPSKGDETGAPVNCNSQNKNKDEGGSSEVSFMSAVGGMAPGGDVVVVQNGIKVVVDSNALFYVIGTEMDYVVRNVEEKFTFRNPNQKYSCGCEESFMPFDADEQL